MTPHGWTRQPLAKFITLQRGMDLPAKKRRPGRFKVLSSGETYGWHDEGPVKGPGFVVGRATNLGRPTWSEEDYWPLNTTLYAKNFHGNDPKFAYFWFLGTDLSAFNSGSVQPMLNRNYIANVPIDVPPVPEQQAIAATLGTLDDKIESNHRAVRAVNALLAAEFDQMFGSRELALELGSLARVVDCLHSKKPSRVGDGPLLMQLDNIRDDGLVDTSKRYPIAADDYTKWSAKFVTQPWDHVITNVGRIGAVARIPDGFVAALGRNMTGIRPITPDESGAFISVALQAPVLRREIEMRTDAGTIMNALNVRSIPQLRMPESTVAERAAFHAIAAPKLEYMDHALAESQRIAALRDALLPELLSGRVRVPLTEAP